MDTKDSSSNEISNLLAKAEQLAEEKDWAEAASVCAKAAGLAPDNHIIQGQLGWYLSRAKRYDEAISIYKQLSAIEPVRAKWPYMLGYQYYAQERYEESVPHFDQALDLDPDYLVVYYRKGYALSQISGRNGDALTAWEKCRKLFNNLTDNEERDRLRKYYAKSCYQQGKLLLKSHKYWHAQVRLNEAVDLMPDDPDVHYALGKSYLEDKQFDKAVECMKLAVKISPKPQHYIFDGLAQAYVGMAMLEEAAEIYEQLPQFARKPYVLRNMGNVYIQLKMWDEAKQALEQAVKRDRRNHNGHYALGLVYEHFGEWSKAVKYFRNAIMFRQNEYGKDFPEAETALALLLMEHPEASASPERKANQKMPSSTSERPIGCVKKYFGNRGFGFLDIPESKDDLFFHIKNVDGRESVEVGEHFQYSVSQGSKGPEAINLQAVQTA